MSRLRGLLLVSRPLSWVNTGLPFLAAGFEVERGLTPLLLLGTVYFLGPYNLLVYGVNDVFDYESDVRNPRKRSLEGAVVAPSEARGTWLAIGLANVPPLVLLAILGGPVAAGALAVTAFVAVAYSAPPLRTKERPVLDSATSALHFVLPAVCGFLVAGRSLDALPWAALAAFLAWGMAAHALGAVQDVASDRAAGIGSIATALGARATARLSLAGFALAVLVTATFGPAGILAAVGLSLYLLLPVMVLARPDDERAARRAWAGFLGLAYLVGFWLTQLLLRHWEVTTYDPWTFLVAVAAGAGALVLASVVATSVVTRRARRGARTAAAPALTIVVPCRDEAELLPAALAALRAQAYPGIRVLVVDDGSSDGSAAVAEGILGPDAVMVAPPKPDGWSGKSWACAVGAAATTSELVLFVDADTVLEPDAAGELVAALQAGRHDLLSGVTRYAMPTRPERIAMPGFALLLFGFVPVWLSALTGGRPARLAFAYGPVLLAKLDAYRRVGGHGAVPASAREDIDLARTFAAAGLRVGTVHAADLGATRHYPTLAGAVAAWRRIIGPYAGGSLAAAIAAVIGQALAFVLPPLLVPLALATGRTGADLAVAAVPLGLLLVARLVLAVGQRQPLATIAWHPVTVLVTLGAQLAGIADLVRGRDPRWRGRTVGASAATAPPLSPPAGPDPVGGTR